MIMEWIEKNYENIKQAVSGLNIRDKDDILHEVLIDFSQKPNAKEIIREGYANKYITQMIKINGWSKTSPYRQKYDKMRYTELIDIHSAVTDEPSTSYCLADLERLGNVFYFDKLAFEVYIERKSKGSFSVRKLSEEINISQSTLSKKIRDIKLLIKKNN